MIAGQTASGKTALSIQIARRFRAEIISADARQFYLEMDAGTAKPTLDELAAVPHHFINHLSIRDQYNAGLYEEQAVLFIDQELKNHQVTVMVGGSGLFLRAVTEGLDTFPPEDPSVREELKQLFDEEGIAPLQELLFRHDSEYYARVDQKNPQRLIRALTVCLSTGMPYSSFTKKQPRPRNFIPLKIGIQVERNELHRRINERVDQMMKTGLLEEAGMLFPFRHLNALQTVGYSELFDYLESKVSLSEAVDAIKRNTRQYAKRQMTWFRKEKDVNWFSSEQVSEIIPFIENKMASMNME